MKILTNIQIHIKGSRSHVVATLPTQIGTSHSGHTRDNMKNHRIYIKDYISNTLVKELIIQSHISMSDYFI